MFQIGDIIEMPNVFSENITTLGVILSINYSEKYPYRILTDKGNYRHYQRDFYGRFCFGSRKYSKIGHLDNSEIEVYKLIYENF